jgi:hypothetical protein
MAEDDQPTPLPAGGSLQVVVACSPAGRPLETVEATDSVAAQHWDATVWQRSPW